MQKVLYDFQQIINCQYLVVVYCVLRAFCVRAVLYKLVFLNVLYVGMNMMYIVVM